MHHSPRRLVHFADCSDHLAAEQVWRYECSPAVGGDWSERTVEALRRPLDFPPVADAIVPGDRVALAIDPNVPELAEIVAAVADQLRSCGAEAIDLVLWDEATEETLEHLRDQLQRRGEPLAGRWQVLRHVSDQREALRYLGPDREGEPLYLSRAVVDADFVLPVVAARPLDPASPIDPTGVFPALADSATRCRYRDAAGEAGQSPLLPDVPRLLGVQVLLSVAADADGGVGRIVAATPEAMHEQAGAAPPRPDDVPPDVSLVVASLDGGAQQQTWANAARALEAATRYVEPGGAILLWTALEEPPGSVLEALGEATGPLEEDAPDRSGDGFPRWDERVAVARTFQRIAAEHRILLHSRLGSETVEALQLGAIGSAEEVRRVSSEFATCGVLPAAQFAASAHPLRSAGSAPSR